MLANQARSPKYLPLGGFLAHPWKIVQKLLVYLIAAGVGLSVGLGVNFSGTLVTTAPLNTGLSTGLSAATSCVLIGFLLNTQTEDIQLTERLRWTWRSLLGSLFSPKHLRTTLILTSFVTLVVGLSFWRLDGELWPGLLLGASVGPSVGLSAGLAYWFLVGLSQGISMERIEEQQRQVPGQGIHISLRSSILMGGISWGVLWLISTFCYGLRMWLFLVPAFGPIEGFQMWLDIEQGPSLLLSWVITYGLILALCGGLIACLVAGGLAAWRHSLIRLLLHRTRQLPLRCVRFFDKAANCILLQKVGGGYSFVHRLLLDYFAS